MFDDFAEQLSKGVHNFGTDVIKLWVSNSAPTYTTDTVIGDISQISYANISGGQPTVTVAVSETGGVSTLSSDEIVLTATGTVPTFRYYGLWNDSATSPADALICGWDHGSTVDLATSETFTIKFNNQSTSGTIMQIGEGTLA
jgi:hypothetical protein